MLNVTQSDDPCKLLVVIVNYRTGDLVIDCLRSLVCEVESLPGTRVVVADNASPDDSLARIGGAISSQNWQDWASLVPLERNGGFAYGNNAILRQALACNNPPLFLLLNPDTVVRPGALTALVEFMEQNPTVGIAGSRLEDPDGTPQISAFRFQSLLSELDAGLRLGLVTKLLTPWLLAPPVPQQACKTDWVAGASMIVRREVFERVGLMDENYFMYFEETDFCLQARNAGWSCWYIPQSRVVHLVGQSTGVTNPKQTPTRLPPYWFASRRRYFLKNHGWLGAAFIDLVWFTGFVLWRIRIVLQGKRNDSPPSLLQDFVRNSVWFNWHLDVIAPATGKAGKQGSGLGLWRQIVEDWDAHGRDWTRPGFRAVAIHRFGVWRMQVKPKLLRAPFSVFYRALYRYVRNIYGIELPYSAQLGRRVIIEHQGDIVIHGSCSIGDDCVIRQGVTIGNRYLNRPLDAPVLGHRVNVGAGAKILGRVILGDDVNIGANAVVLNDVESGQTAVGIPAKVLHHSDSSTGV